jgi:hypothetical protein
MKGLGPVALALLCTLSRWLGMAAAEAEEDSKRDYAEGFHRGISNFIVAPHGTARELEVCGLPACDVQASTYPATKLSRNTRMR